jgi:hypothetical protein
MLFSSAITTTLLLPLLGYTPAMHGRQSIAVVWVDTARDTWGDTTEARERIDAALRWWEARVAVSFTVEETRLTIDVDPYTYDICHDRSWAPQGRAFYMIAWEPTYRIFTCDGVNVADWADVSGALLWGGVRVDEIAHTVGHLYGAHDEDEPGIMNFPTMQQSYREGRVSEATFRAIGASPVAAPGLLARGLRERQQGARVDMSYQIERYAGGV